MKNLQALEKRIKIQFKNPKILVLALTHRSFLNEASDQKLESNERLEFLGDAILSFVSSAWLYNKYPHYPEGKLTNIRSNLVKTEALAKLAYQYSLGDYLFLSRGESESGGSKNSSLLANTFESLIGAVYLDQGLEIVKEFIENNLSPMLKELVKKGEFKDHKSLLQEKLQAKYKEAPIYRLLEQNGPDHEKIFTIGVFQQNKLLASANGKSKQEAEEMAAKAALEKLKPKQ